MMRETLGYLKKEVTSKELFSKVEIIIVDDGSKDGTFDLIKGYSEEYSNIDIRVLGVQLSPNKGKGAAVKYGSLFASGKYILFLDADGATDINGFGNLYKRMKVI